MKKMSVPGIVYTLVMLICLSVFPVFAQGNLIRNPSFEGTGSENYLEDWKGTGYSESPDVVEFRFDTELTHSGKASALIINHKPNHSRFIQNVPVKELSIYKFSAWVFTDNVDMDFSGAGISIQDKWPSCGDFRLTTPAWEYTELYVVTGKSVSFVTIMLNLGFYASDNTGKAWFDDISFIKVNDLPENATATVVDPIGDKIAEASASKYAEPESVDPVQKVLLLIVIGCTIVLISGGLYYLIHLYISVYAKKPGKIKQ
jgi:hypothetical protein